MINRQHTEAFAPIDWSVACSLDDPILGLGYEPLSDFLDSRLRPRGWDPDMARELAQTVWILISTQITKMASLRTRWESLARALCLTCAAERYDEETGDIRPSPFPELAVFSDELRQEHAFGWGSGESVFRRLYEYNIEHGPFRDVGAGNVNTWELSHPRDFTSLDLACVRAAKRGPIRLPIEVCSIFAAPARSIFVRSIGESVSVPSLWQMLAAFILFGPEEARMRLLSAVGEMSTRQLAPRVDRPEGGTVAPRTLARLAAEGFTWQLRAHELSGVLPSLSAWKSEPRRVGQEELARVEEWRADRSAVPLITFRRARSKLRAQVESYRRLDGSLDPRRSLRVLRDLLLLDLLATGARIGMIHRIKPCDYESAWHCDGRVVPAVRMYPNKWRSGRPAAPRMIPIYPETAGYLEEWLRLVGLSRVNTCSIWVSRYEPARENEDD